MITKFVVKNILNEILSSIAQDIQDNALTPEDMFLYRIFSGIEGSKLDIVDQAKKIFSRTENSRRKLEIKFQFDKDVPEIPTIYIKLPSDQMGKVMGIGGGVDEYSFYDNEDGTTSNTRSRGFAQVYDIYIASQSEVESEIIYETLIHGLISMYDNLSLSFNTFSITGKELVISTDIMPLPMFMKTISLSIDVDRKAPQLKRVTNITDYYFEAPVVYPNVIESIEVIADENNEEGSDVFIVA